MDALGEVATEAGETLFSDPQADLKGRIGQKMADKLKAETDPLRKNNGDLILIGSMEEEKEPEASEAERESAEEENPEAAEAAEGAPEEAPPASEAAEAEPDAEA